MANNIVVGVDIGSSKVTVVAASHGQDEAGVEGLEVIGFGEVPLKLGAVVNGSVENVVQVGSAIKAALDQVSSISNLEIGVVNVSFGGMHVAVSKQSDGVIRPTSSAGDEVTVQDVAQLVNDIYRAKKDANFEVMHVLPQYFTVDSSTGIREPVGRPGIKLSGDFLVLSANSQSIKRTKRSLSTADSSIVVERLIFAPIATGMSVLTQDEKEAGIALIDIGDHTTDLLVYQDNIIRHVASFPVAGRHITADLKVGCGIQAEHAEKLKKEYGTALSEKVPNNIEIIINYLSGRPPRQVLKKNVALIVEERLKEIASMVYAEIRRLNLVDDLIGGVVITGGTSNIPDIETVFKRVMTGMNVRVGLPVGLKRTPKADIVSSANYATAVGLAWAGIHPVDERLDFTLKSTPKVATFGAEKPSASTSNTNPWGYSSRATQAEEDTAAAKTSKGGGGWASWFSSIKNSFSSRESDGNEGGEY